MPTKYQGTEREVRVLNAYIKLQRASESLLLRTNAHLTNFGLTTSQFAILEALYHLGTLSQVELASKLLKSTGNISSVLKNIERRGLIARERDPDDNRYMQVSITAEGQELIEDIFDDHVAGIMGEMSILSDRELEELARLCRKLGLGVGV